MKCDVTAGVHSSASLAAFNIASYLGVQEENMLLIWFLYQMEGLELTFHQVFVLLEYSAARAFDTGSNMALC